MPKGSESPDVAVRVMLRPLGSSLPLGLLALGGASTVLSGLQLGWLPVTASRNVGLVVLAFAAPAQLLAAVFGFLSRDSVGGTGMTILAGTWITIGVLEITSPPGTPNATLGLFLFFASAAIGVPIAAAVLGKALAASVLFLAAVRFALTGIYEFHGAGAWKSASGWVGVAVAVIAVYSALAFELEDTQRRNVLPVLRRGSAKTAVTGGPAGELERLNREAGVREQL